MKLRKAENLNNKTILLRVDFNVPLSDGKIADSFRIDETIPSIISLLEAGSKVILVSHLGNPKGKEDPRLSLSPICSYLEIKLNRKIYFIKDLSPELIKKQIDKIPLGEVILLENIRFHPGEEQNDLDFAKNLASFADIYINDAFSCCHRAHASIEKISILLPSYAGPLLLKEITNIEKYIDHSKKPFGAILGGAKISTKINLIKSLLNKIDVLFIGGAMANVFLKARNIDIGGSYCEENYDNEILEIEQLAKRKNVKIILPVDFMASSSISDHAYIEYVLGDKLGGNMILDIGPKTVTLFADEMSNLATVIWNGPVGAFENKPYDKGTLEVAKKIADLTLNKKLISVIGGGDTASAVGQMGLKDHFTYVSTGGGAFLTYLEDNNMPGIKNLLI